MCVQCMAARYVRQTVQVYYKWATWIQAISFMLHWSATLYLVWVSNLLEPNVRFHGHFTNAATFHFGEINVHALLFRIMNSRFEFAVWIYLLKFSTIAWLYLFRGIVVAVEHIQHILAVLTWIISYHNRPLFVLVAFEIVYVIKNLNFSCKTIESWAKE